MTAVDIYSDFHGEIQHLPHCFVLLHIGLCKWISIFEARWGSSMQLGTSTKHARVSRSKRNRENREIPGLRGRVALRAYNCLKTGAVFTGEIWRIGFAPNKRY